MKLAILLSWIFCLGLASSAQANYLLLSRINRLGFTAEDIKRLDAMAAALRNPAPAGGATVQEPPKADETAATEEEASVDTPADTPVDTTADLPTEKPAEAEEEALQAPSDDEATVAEADEEITEEGEDEEQEFQESDIHDTFQGGMGSSLHARGALSWTSGAFKSNWQDTWKVTKDSYGQKNRDLVPDPTGGSSGDVMEVTYPAGSRNPKNGPVGGTGFFAAPISLKGAKTVTLSFQILFPKGFNFVKGGKLPGLYGGRTGCSGGDSALDCFSTRFMFRTKGLGEIYLYVDRKLQDKSFCQVKPVTLCNPQYGASMGRGAYSFTPGSWMSLTQTITLNTFKGKKPNKDGRVQVYANGKKVIDFDKVVFIPKPTIGFEGIDFETFFGGSDDSWCTPSTQQVYFKGFSLTAV